MGTGNGDLVREATMRGVRQHIRAGVAAKRNPEELLAEVISLYDLTAVEAGLAKAMVRRYVTGREMPTERRHTSGKDA